MAWNQKAFESACRKFRDYFSDFEDFEHPGEEYIQVERAYKDELIELYNNEVRPALDGPPAEFLEKYEAILKHQNQIDWRTVNDLKKAAEKDREAFGQLLQTVLLAENTPKAMTDYGPKAAKLMAPHINRAGIRGLVSMLLMLHKPGQFMYGILTLWQDVGERFIGDQLLKKGSLIDGEEFGRCQTFAVQVREALDQAGFRPRDMIDVQSFMYVLTREPSSPEPEPEPEPEPAPDPPAKPSLASISKYIKSQGMRIDERTLRRYHYAMRTRGFVILAGPSGTGKTWLTKLYAEAVGAEYTAAPVAPNWAANEDLLGYFNPIDQKFHASAFLEFIDRAAASWDKHRGGAPEFHLTLDEMNLARIEHYFSLFLSLMEQRHEDASPETELTGGRTVRIPPNLKFAGTVNMDETTHGFADKVFDRAQLIELSIDKAAVKAHLEGKPYASDLLDIWEKTEPSGPFGFRVLDDIAAYIAEAEKDGVDWREALDDQIVSKILPKLRGIEPEAAEALQGVAALTAERFPLASAKCAVMRRRQQATDVVSFF